MLPHCYLAPNMEPHSFALELPALVHQTTAQSAPTCKYTMKIATHQTETVNYSVDEIESSRHNSDRTRTNESVYLEMDSVDNSSNSSLTTEESIILNDVNETDIHENETVTQETEEDICTIEYTNSSDVEQAQQTKRGITCLYTNADSLLGKRDLLKWKIADWIPDVIAITETLPKNLTRSSLDQQVEYSIPGYNMILGRHNKRGVVMYIANHLQAIREDKLTESEHEEQVWCTIKTRRGEKILLGTVYHSPNSSPQNHEYLRSLIQDSCSQEYDNIVIMGDFNMPGIDWEAWNGHNNRDNCFIQTLQDHYLYQLVENPTRYRTGQNPSLVDLVLTNKEELISDLTYTDPLGKSDHLCLRFEIQVDPEKNDTTQLRYRMDRGDYEKMANMFQSCEWERNTKDLDIEETWNYFQAEYDHAVKTCIPISKVKPARWRRPLWMTGEAMKLTKRKYWAWQRYRRTGRHEDYNRYCMRRNKAQAVSDRLRRNFERLIAQEAKSKPKSFWTYVRSQTKTKEALSPLDKGNGELTQNDMEKAQVLNQFFSSVFTREDINTITDLAPREYTNQLDNIQIGTQDVEKLLIKLKPEKSPGPDQIHPRVLKECSKVLTLPLYLIFRKSMAEGRLPSSWKDANVTPIYKKGKRKEANNYRPVSLTSIVCKMMERLIRDSIMTHMDNNRLLVDNQYGFRNKRSTTLQLLSVIDHWTEIMDEGNSLDVLYLDFSKAFDTVPHQRLLKKLEAHGIKGTILRWTADFLKDRRQRVNVNGSLSEWLGVLSGIPQGSVLGPVLFIIYINDLPEAVKNFAMLFADDTKLYAVVNNDEDHESLQYDMDSLITWSDKWQLSFNATKCKVMHYGRSNHNYNYTMVTNNVKTNVATTTEEKDLGVVFSTDLKFSTHVATAANKANRVVGAIRRSFRYMDKAMFVLLYKALVRGHLEYANTVWNPIKISDLEHLEKVQRRATKMVPELKDLPYPERLKRLKLPSLVYRRDRGDMIETFKILNGHTDLGKSCLLPLATKSSTRGHSLKLRKDYSRTSLRQHVFSQRVVEIWNKLPEDLVIASSINAFKNGLDKHWATKSNLFHYRD